MASYGLAGNGAVPVTQVAVALLSVSGSKAFSGARRTQHENVCTGSLCCRGQSLGVSLKATSRHPSPRGSPRPLP